METEFGFEIFRDETLRDRLKEELSQRKKNNPEYSLRALARDLKIPHTALSEFLNGRRRFSAKLTESIVNQLSISAQTQNQLKKSHIHNPLNYVNLSNEEISRSREWYMTTLLELAKLENFSSDPHWIAKVLRLDLFTVTSAIEELQKLGWLEITPSGKWHVKDENTSTLGNLSVLDDILYKLAQFAELQRIAIQTEKPETGSNVGITFAIDPDDLPKARKMTYEFLYNMSELLEKKATPKKEVYRLNISLFPLTKARHGK